MDLFALGKIWFLEAKSLLRRFHRDEWRALTLPTLPTCSTFSITLYCCCALLHACWCLGPFTQVGLPMLSLACPLAKTGWMSCTRHVSKGGKGAARWPRWFMLCRVTQKLFQPPTNIIPTSYFVTRGQPSPWDTSAVIWKCKIWLMFQISNFG